MNFFGHAVVATWSGAPVEGVLGSMLPDFEAMMRVPLVEVRNAAIEGGVQLHHRTDDVFHRCPSFLGLSQRALTDLTSAGVRRGTARAVAHIATEMFLDGHLASDADCVDRYLVALQLEPHGEVEWEDGGAAYQSLSSRLRRWGAPHDYSATSFVLDRLRDALARRPALAIARPDEDPVRECLPALRERVNREARELLDQVRDALGFSD